MQDAIFSLRNVDGANLANLVSSDDFSSSPVTDADLTPTTKEFYRIYAEIEKHLTAANRAAALQINKGALDSEANAIVESCIHSVASRTDIETLRAYGSSLRLQALRNDGINMISDIPAVNLSAISGLGQRTANDIYRALEKWKIENATNDFSPSSPELENVKKQVKNLAIHMVELREKALLKSCADKEYENTKAVKILLKKIRKVAFGTPLFWRKKKTQAANAACVKWKYFSKNWKKFAETADLVLIKKAAFTNDSYEYIQEHREWYSENCLVLIRKYLSPNRGSGKAWIKCSYCGHLNQVSATKCEVCGHDLIVFEKPKQKCPEQVIITPPPRAAAEPKPKQSFGEPTVQPYVSSEGKSLLPPLISTVAHPPRKLVEKQKAASAKAAPSASVRFVKLDDLNKLTDIYGASEGGDIFERVCMLALMRLGYVRVVHVGSANDFGIDVLAEKDGKKYGIQCKCYKNNLNIKPLQEVFGGYKLAQYACDVPVIMTNSKLNRNAKKYNMNQPQPAEVWDKTWFEKNQKLIRFDELRTLAKAPRTDRDLILKNLPKTPATTER